MAKNTNSSKPPTLTAEDFINKSARKLPPLQVGDESQVPGSFFFTVIDEID